MFPEKVCLLKPSERISWSFNVRDLVLHLVSTDCCSCHAQKWKFIKYSSVKESRFQKVKQLTHPTYFLPHQKSVPRPKMIKNWSSWSMIVPYTIEKPMERDFEKIKIFWSTPPIFCHSQKLLMSPKMGKISVQIRV